MGELGGEWGGGGGFGAALRGEKVGGGGRAAKGGLNGVGDPLKRNPEADIISAGFRGREIGVKIVWP